MRRRGVFIFLEPPMFIVLDLDSGKSVGDIADTPGVHGIALAPELGPGLISNGREGHSEYF